MNPEDSVIDAIDALVDEQLAEGPVDDYSVNRYDKCALCRGDWHGLTDPESGCPGAYARGYQKRKWQQFTRNRWRGDVATRDYVTEIHRRMAREAAERFEREFIQSLNFTGQVYGEAERELRPEEWSEIYGVPVGQLGIDPPQPRYEQLDFSRHFIPPHERAQRPSSVPRDSRPCAQCQRPLEWRAAYTFDGTSPLCHDCYDNYVRRARGETMEQWVTASRRRIDEGVRRRLQRWSREGVTNEFRTGQFDISQDAVHRLRTSGT